MINCQGRRLQYGFAYLIFLSLLLTQLINSPTYPLHLVGAINSNIDPISIADDDLSEIFIPKSTEEEEEVASQIPHPAITKVQPYNLEKTVRNLSSFHTRHSGSEFIDDAAYWLAAKLQGICGTDVHIQNFTVIPDKTIDYDDEDLNGSHSQKPFSYNLKNIACVKPGSTNNTIIVSAHYDSRTKDLNDSKGRAPGADDNASGVSILLEVARILSNLSLEHSISFVLFSGEEQGKWGSKYYADYVDDADIDLELLINLDMVGFQSQGSNNFLVEYDNGNIVQDNDKYSQRIAQFIKDIALKYTSLNTTLGILGNADCLHSFPY